jgi:hypothetical protein
MKAVVTVRTEQEFLDLTWGPDEHLTVSATAECASVVAVWAARSVLP